MIFIDRQQHCRPKEPINSSGSKKALFFTILMCALGDVCGGERGAATTSVLYVLAPRSPLCITSSSKISGSLLLQCMVMIMAMKRQQHSLPSFSFSPGHQGHTVHLGASGVPLLPPSPLSEQRRCVPMWSSPHCEEKEGGGDSAPHAHTHGADALSMHPVWPGPVPRSSLTKYLSRVR